MSVVRCRNFYPFLAALLLVGAGGWAGAAEPGSLKVGVLTDNYPFSFRADNGEIQGFAHDVMREVDRVMALKLEFVPGTTGEINPAFAAGRLDLLQSFAHSPEREATVDFSFPYLTMVGAIFVRDGEARIATLADLRGRKVAVHRGSLGEAVLRRAGLGDSIMLVDSVRDALGEVDRGGADATLASRLTGLSLAHRLGLKQVRPLAVAVDGYEVRYCIAVRKGESQLLARVNEGLAVLARTGRFEVIHQRWFGALEPAKYSVEQVVLIIAAGLALALAIALWAGLRQRTLRLKIAGQAEELRQSEERHRAIFEGTHDGLIVLGPPDHTGDYPVEQMNPAACRLLRLGERAWMGATLQRLLPAEVALHGLIAAAVTDRSGAVTGEYACANQAGWWRVTVGPLGSRTLVAVADITETTETRERLHRQEEQMRHTQKLEAIGTLAGGVAHDFNNLLTAIMGNTELSLMTLPPKRVEAENLRQVMNAARRARQIVKQILTFSRHSEPTRELLSVSPVLEETVSFLQTVARAAVKIEHVRAERLPNIVADAAQLHQVLMNIGTNAVQAMRGAPGKLTITEEVVAVGAEVQAQHPKLSPGSYVRIGIRDTGAGMTAEVRERIFEPFFTTKAKGEGTGLGLSVVYGIMEKHGGAVTVYSQPGRGSLFHLYFPAAPGDATTALTEDWSRVPQGRGERVLLVDDDAVIVATAEQILTRLGYHVSAHSRAADALAEFFAPGAEFAVVVSDLSMPECTGLELAARFRAVKPLVPFVLASGFFSAAEEAEAEALRITLRLHKPLTYGGLGRAVAKALGRGSRAPFVVG